MARQFLASHFQRLDLGQYHPCRNSPRLDEPSSAKLAAVLRSARRISWARRRGLSPLDPNRLPDIIQPRRFTRSALLLDISNA